MIFFNSIEPCVVGLINSSLMSSCVPAAFKHAVVHPFLKKKKKKKKKKANLDVTVLSNYRLSFKLLFLSKVLEKVVYEQLQSYLDLILIVS